MQTITSIQEMSRLCRDFRKRGKSIALVPTMGALHEGHTSLIDVAREKADVVIVTIFVNPKQFGPNEDYQRYPRDMEADQTICKKHQADVIFAPSVDELYPSDFSTYVVEEAISKRMCGVSRPGHFRGVCTVVAKLFNICVPDMAVFGQKDAQQSAIITKMVRDLHMGVDIVIAPTVREEDGLALSSRNRYLSRAQREEAARIYQALCKGKAVVDQGNTQTDRVEAEITNHLIASRRVRVIYVVIANRETMEPVKHIEPGKCLMAVAAWVDEVRLIDNLLV